MQMSTVARTRITLGLVIDPSFYPYGAVGNTIAFDVRVRNLASNVPFLKKRLRVRASKHISLVPQVSKRSGYMSAYGRRIRYHRPEDSTVQRKGRVL